MKKYKRLFRKPRTAILHFRSYYSNYYITLTDLSYNVILSCSAGSVSDTNNKKTKTSTVVITPMLLRILVFLRANKIRRLKFEVRNKMDKFFHNSLRFLRKKGIRVKTLSFIKRAPHHFGQREKKPRRI